MRDILRTASLLVLLFLYYGSKAEGGIPQCARATPGKDTPLATNRVSKDTWEPLFHLKVSHDGEDNYSVAVKVGSSPVAFSDAFISAETNSSCGVGDLLYDSDDFLLVKTDRVDCPHVLTTNRKHAMWQLPPLRWKMPKCGCVHFRVTVIVEGQTYFAEREDVVEGPLATTVCPESTHRKVSREERRDLLCRINSRFSGAEILQRGEFMERHQLNARFLDRTKMEMALHARRSDILECCQKLHGAREECFDDVRRRRVDDVCDDGSPEIPFTAQRMRFMRDREQACCWKIGEARYDCFALNAGTKHGAWSPDFSLDESDPVNDLGDYPTEILALEQEYDTPLFGMVGSTAQMITTTPTTTTTTVATTTRMTTTTAANTAPPMEDRKPVAIQGVLHSSTDKRRSRELDDRAGTRTSSSELDDGAGTRASSREVDDGAGTKTSSRERKSRQLVKPQKPRSREQSPIGRDAGVGSSRELGEQQGGRSAQKAQTKLERRIWKMQLKTSCCQAGMEAASGLVGAFQTVWGECKHSSHKFLQARRKRDGRQICMNEFRFCCMDMATSLSTGVVTSQPETKSSAEWDRDRDLVGKVYLPPHSRAHHAQALRRTSSSVATPTPWNSQERSWPSGSLRARGSSSVTQPEVEDPQHKRRAEQRGLIQSLRTQLEEEDDIDEDYRPVMKDPRRTADSASPSFAARRREPENTPAGSDQNRRGESESGEEMQNGKESEVKRKRSRSQEVSAVASADQDGKERQRTSSLEAARKRLKHRRHETEEELLRWLLLEVDQDHVEDLVDEDGNGLGSEEIAETASTVSAEYEDDDEVGDGNDDYFDSKDIDRSDEDIFASASRGRNSRGNSQNADKENRREEKHDVGRQVVPVVSPASSSVAHNGDSEQGPQQSPSEGRKQTSESSRDISASASSRESSEEKETTQTPAIAGGSSRSRSSASVSEFSEETESAADDLSSEDGHNSSRYYHPASGGRSTRRRHARGRMAKGRLGKNVRRGEHTKPRITEALEEE